MGAVPVIAPVLLFKLSPAGKVLPDLTAYVIGASPVATTDKLIPAALVPILPKLPAAVLHVGVPL